MPMFAFPPPKCGFSKLKNDVSVGHGHSAIVGSAGQLEVKPLITQIKGPLFFTPCSLLSPLLLFPAVPDSSPDSSAPLQHIQTVYFPLLAPLHTTLAYLVPDHHVEAFCIEVTIYTCLPFNQISLLLFFFSSDVKVTRWPFPDRKRSITASTICDLSAKPLSPVLISKLHTNACLCTLCMCMS